MMLEMVLSVILLQGQLHQVIRVATVREKVLENEKNSRSGKSQGITFILSYDTTFSMGDFYVSPLLFKHCCFIQKPIIPALFLIHERKLQDHHQAVFKVLRERMKGKLNQVPIAIDMEQGIKGAIETETTLYIVGCWRHLKKDIEAWSLKHQVVKQESKRLVDDIFSILRTKNNFQPLLESKRENWPPEFNQYFKKHLESRLPNYCLQYIQKHVNADDFNGITTNQSEGFNWLIKDLNNWKEGPIDCILLSFRFLQQYFLSEIRRGRAAIGNFTLTSAMAQRTIDMDSLDMQPPVCDFKEIVNLIRNKGFPEDAETAKTEPNLSFRAKAKEIVMANRIAFCPSFGSFVVIGATGQSFVAKLYPKETCTCAVKSAKCCHVLAVKLALRMTVEDDDSYGQDSDITKPRKFIRGKKKPGRKQPRPGDVDEPAIEIPEKKCCTEDEIGGPSLSSEENTMRQSIDAVNDAIWLFSVDGISLNLSQEEKRRIEGSFDNGWLSDTIIDATQAVLRQQFPYDEGMQSVLYAAKPEFQPVSGRFVQIINTHPNDGGLHWICFSNFNSDDGIVNLYDSSGEIYMSTATERAVAKIMCTPLPKIFVRHMKCSKQTNGNDCGVYAIANMVSILHGVDPSSISFNVAAMRRHLLQGLENKKNHCFPP